jgi:hypothetical protein
LYIFKAYYFKDNDMLRYTIFLLLLIPVLTLLPSCRTAAPLAPEEPIVVLISPNDGEILDRGAVEVRIYVQNFVIVPVTGQANKAGEGHVIYYLDASAPLKLRTPATTAPGTFAVSAEDSYTWQDVPPGQHTFTVQLVNKDNTPLDQPVTVRANVTVR